MYQLSLIKVIKQNVISHIEKEDEERRMEFIITLARRPSERPELDLHLSCWLGGSLPDLCPWKNSNDLAKASL